MGYGQIKHSKIIARCSARTLKNICILPSDHTTGLVKFIILIENVFYFRRIERYNIVLP